LKLNVAYGINGHKGCKFTSPMKKYQGQQIKIVNFTGYTSGSFKALDQTGNPIQYSFTPDMCEEYTDPSFQKASAPSPVKASPTSGSGNTYLNVNALKKFYEVHPEQKPLVVKITGIEEYNDFISFLSKSPYIWKSGQALSDYTPSSAKLSTYIVLTSSIKKIYTVPISAVGARTIFTYPKFKKDFAKTTSGKSSTSVKKSGAAKKTVFKKGKSYQWVGPGKHQFPEYNYWNHEGGMDYLLDGEPHKLIVLTQQPTKVNALDAKFEVTPGQPDVQYWYWHGADKYLKEVEA